MSIADIGQTNRAAADALEALSGGRQLYDVLQTAKAELLQDRQLGAKASRNLLRKQTRLVQMVNRDTIDCASAIRMFVKYIDDML